MIIDGKLHLFVNGVPLDVNSYEFTVKDVNPTRVTAERWTTTAEGTIEVNADELDDFIAHILKASRERTRYWQRRLASNMKRYRKWLAREFGTTYQEAREMCRRGER